MLMPQNNPEGYERSSLIKAAKDLHGVLLLIHGVIDDNVHMQNTMALAYELQKAGKPFRLMLYESRATVSPTRRSSNTFVRPCSISRWRR
jgi:dipeptidyl-peptidase-4